jgi:cysteinyl-tRNA synthetase
MTLYLYNTIKKDIELFKPIDSKNVRMYVCGPTVYNFAHIGNARPCVVFDVLFRLLQKIYGHDSVTYVRNITDIDDKINNRAKELGISIQELTKSTTKDFHEDLSYLNCKSPTFEPRATDHVNEMCDIIDKLIENNHAYIAKNNHVYFHVPSFDNYGLISSVSKDALEDGFRIDVEELKKDARDFVLWKPADNEDDVSSIFNSKFGQGRPGWHIECSAMAKKYLGDDFDIHGGGIDLSFPHHTNEIAQSVCAHKGSKFANTWVHNGFLTVNGEKMSKSLNNFITVRELKDKGINGEALRLFLMRSHYRKPLDYTDQAIKDSKTTLDFLYRAMYKASSYVNTQDYNTKEFYDFLFNDLNVHMAIEFLYSIARKINTTIDQSEINMLASVLKELGNFLGLLNNNNWFCNIDLHDISEEDINNLINERAIAKNNKNYSKADEIRKHLESMNIILEDLKEKTIWRYKQ